ncbi:MAG: hypothetical protein WBM29_01955 [Candidatus Deferrimicrobium sp.]
MQVSKRIAVVGLNVSMSVFVGISVYGFIKYAEGGFAAAQSTSSLATVVFSVLIVASIAGICFFGHQLDLRNLAIHREEEARKAAEAARKGRRKPVKGE